MERLRRTLMYVPGSNPALIRSAGLFVPDVLCFDLEDSVALAEKDSARLLLRHALEHLELINPGGSEVMVRVNALDSGLLEEDLAAVVRPGLEAIRLPKAESAGDVRRLGELLERAESEAGLSAGSIRVSPVLESVAGITAAREIATASSRVMGLSFGAEDYTRDLGAERTREGDEIRHARGELILAAKAAGRQAYDTVFGDVADEAGLEAEARRARGLGFDGKSVIHPAQIAVVHRAFDPSEEEIRHARRVLTAIRHAEAEGAGVVSLDGRMVDAPVRRRAERVLARARLLGGEVQDG